MSEQPQTDARLADWLDERMTAEQLAAFEAELAESEGLRQAADSYRHTAHSVAADDTDRAPLNFADSVLAAIDEPTGRAPQFRLLVGTVVTAAAAGILLIVSFGRGDSTQPATERGLASADQPHEEKLDSDAATGEARRKPAAAEDDKPAGLAKKAAPLKRHKSDGAAANQRAAPDPQVADLGQRAMPTPDAKPTAPPADGSVLLLELPNTEALEGVELGGGKDANAGELFRALRERSADDLAQRRAKSSRSRARGGRRDEVAVEEIVAAVVDAREQERLRSLYAESITGAAGAQTGRVPGPADAAVQWIRVQGRRDRVLAYLAQLEQMVSSRGGKLRQLQAVALPRGAERGVQVESERAEQEPQRPAPYTVWLAWRGPLPPSASTPQTKRDRR